MNTIVQALEKHSLNPDIIFGQRVLLRVDLNVPLANGTIIDDFTLLSILPTINLLQQYGARIVLATHLGQPSGHRDPTLSTQHLIPWFNHHDYNVIFCPSLERPFAGDKGPGTIFLLENLRFWPGEQEGNPHFAELLAQWGSCYVNDAFADCHSTDASITQTPLLFPVERRFVGPLLMHEVNYLAPLINNPEHPFIAIVGGGKTENKLALIESLLNTADTILLCPNLSFAGLELFGHPIGQSYSDRTILSQMKDIFHQATQKKVSVLLPFDYQVAHNSIEGPLELVDANAIPRDAIGISIGPKTLKAWKPIIHQAKTIFFNAAMGFFEYPETLYGLQIILEIIEKSSGYTVVAGSHSVAAARRFNLTSAFNYLSTGGNTSLTFLSGKPLPGLQPFLPSHLRKI